eukprot:jgi/Ulvmu1/2199/UM013_0045.1
MHEVERLQAQLMACQLGPPLSIDEADLDIGDTLGTGGFSVVYRGTWFCTPVAIKKWFASDTHQLEIRGEIMTNAGLRHPNIVTFCGACLQGPNALMVSELLPFSLLQVLYDMPNIPLPIAKCTSIAVDIARAFCYLHTRIPQVIHRDLKPQNVLLDRAWKVKLCDFGLAGSTKVDAGTPAYMAPELLGTEGLYTDKVDVYAFGVLFNEMLSRRPPFAGSDGNRALELAKTGQRPEIPLSAPPAAKALIQSCWHGEPTERPTFRQINADLMALQGT